MSTLTGFRISPQQATWWQHRHSQRQETLVNWLQVGLPQPLAENNLRERVQQLVEREEILRTSLRCPAGMALPIQVINDDFVPPVDVLDWSELSEQDQAASRSQLCHDAEECPLRVSLIRHADDSRSLLLRAPASHLDIQSLALIADELAGAPCPNERLQYADYAEWKCGLLEAEDNDAGLKFWQQQMQEPADVLLPGLESSATAVDFTPSLFEVDLGADIGALRMRAAALGATVDEYLFAAWALLVARLRGETQIQLAWVHAGRGEGLEDALGALEQALPLTLEVNFADGFAAQLEALLRPKRLGLGWSDYYDSTHTSSLYFAYRAFDAVRAESASTLTARYHLGLDCFESFGELRCRIAFDSARFQDEALACLAEQFQLLIQGLQETDAPVGSVGLQGVKQARCLRTPQAEPTVEPVGVPILIDRQARSQPDSAALVGRDGSLTYAELSTQSNQLAHYLVKAGVQAGDVVGILLPRGSSAIVAMLAVLKAGGVYLPLDPNYPKDRLAYMASDSGLSCLISTSVQAGLLPDVATRVLLDELGPTPAHESAEALPPVADLDQLAYLIYTSGSTGQPKAVEISHRNLSHSTQVRMAFYEEPVKAYLLLSSFAFDSSVAGIYWTLAQGGALVLPADKEELDLAVLADLIQTHGVSHSLSLPSLYETLLDFATTEQLASLSTWIVAGEACAPQVLAKHREKLPGARLVNEYGPTEATVWATAEVLTDSSDISIGRPIPTMQLHLINEQGVPSALGEPGEIHLGGPQLSPGYRARPEQTARAFVRFPDVAGGDRLYKTGDLARFGLDGRLSFLGRTDHQVKIRGFRVELGEIERQLKNHSEVRDAAVVAQESAGTKRLVAYTTSRHGYAADSQALASFLAARLPGYMVPSSFVHLKEFPRTPNGKLDVKALPDPDLSQQNAGFVAPRTELEETLAAICADVLRREQVGVMDSFFQIGGDSILSLQIVARASQQGIRITARQVFERETVARMAEVATRVAQSESAEQAAPEPAAPEPAVPEPAVPQQATTKHQGTAGDFPLAQLDEDDLASLLDELNAE